MGQTAEESFDTLSLLPLVPNVAKNFWREATKNFASKDVQRQQGEELLRVSGKLDILLPLSALYLLRSTSYPRRVTLAALYVWGLRSIVSFSATCKNNHYIIVIHLTN